MDLLLILVFLVLLGLSAFFSGSETALMSVDRITLHRRSGEGDSRAALILRQRDDPHRMLSAILIGNNVANTGAAALATAWAVKALGEGMGILVATGGVTVLLLVFSEILPKTVAALRPWGLGRIAAVPIWGLQTALFPFIALLDLVTRPLLRWLRPGGRGGASTGAADIRTVLALARGGEVPERVLQMVDRGLHLADIRAEEIMVPRVQAVMVEQETTLDDVVQLHRRKGHSRFPVFAGDPDRTVGLLHISDVLDVPSEEWGRTPASRLLRPVLQIPGGTPLHDLLRRMQAQALHLAVVVDEYGGTDGIVTLEDVIEEVVGSILDEQDLDREAEVVSLGSGVLRVRGSVSLGFLERETGIDLTEPHLTTLGGLIQHLLARPARVKDRVVHGGYELTVERTTRRGVALATIRRLSRDGAEGGGDDDNDEASGGPS